MVCPVGVVRLVLALPPDVPSRASWKYAHCGVTNPYNYYYRTYEAPPSCGCNPVVAPPSTAPLHHPSLYFPTTHRQLPTLKLTKTNRECVIAHARGHVYCLPHLDCSLCARYVPERSGSWCVNRQIIFQVCNRDFSLIIIIIKLLLTDLK